MAETDELHQAASPSNCIDDGIAVVAVGKHATATINRLSSDAIDKVQNSGVHQFLVAVANTTNATQHFDPQEHIEATYDPAKVLNESVFCGFDLTNADREKCQDLLAGQSDGGQRSVPLISSTEARIATGGRIQGAVSIQKLPYANSVLENVVLTPEAVMPAKTQSLTVSSNLTVVPELVVADIAPGEKVSGTMALDVGEAIEGGNIAVKVSVGNDTHEFVYCIADVG